MRVLLLRPPRYMWPFNRDESAFWPPLGLLCLAAAVRRELPDVRIEVWDAPGNCWGWRPSRSTSSVSARKPFPRTRGCGRPHW